MGANTIAGVIGPIPLIKREIWTHTKEPMAYRQGGGNWSDSSKWQGTPKIAGYHQKVGERHETDSQSLQKN